MKKSILVLGLAAMFMACNNANTAPEVKTAYVDSAKLLKEYNEVKDAESKFKIKSEEKGKSFESEIAKFQQDVQNFQREAAQKGQAWAQKRAAELQQKEQELQYKQQTIAQGLQTESGEEMELILTKVKEQIAEYAKKNNLDFVLNTEDASTVVYAKEGYNITDQILKELNDKYKGSTAASKVDEPVKTEEVTTEEKK